MKRLVVLALLLTALATPRAAAEAITSTAVPPVVPPLLLGAPQSRIAQRQSTVLRIVATEVAGSNPAPGGQRASGAPLVSGNATWYAWHPGEAAAGPPLRKALGSHWRGTVVRVCATACVTVRLTDWCLCGHGRVIDLDSRSFAKLAPLSQGIVRVSVYVGGHEAHPTPHRTAPPTDVGP